MQENIFGSPMLPTYYSSPDYQTFSVHSVSGSAQKSTDLPNQINKFLKDHDYVTTKAHLLY